MNAGYEVAGQAENGADVIKLCAQAKRDVVFLDINVSKLNGFDALATIREVSPKVHVVMLSASSMIENVRESMRTGVNGFIVKPFTRNKVLHALKNVRR